MEFLEFLISTKCAPSFFAWKVIYIGGGTQVADLLKRNRTDEFLSREENVIAILDGDRQGQRCAVEPNVYLLPIPNIEAALHTLRANDPDFPFITERENFTSDKDFFNYLQQKHITTTIEIFEYVWEKHDAELAALINTLTSFLSYPVQAPAGVQ